MKTILVILVIGVGIFLALRRWAKRRSGTGARLMETFEQLRELLLDGMSEEHRSEASALLDRCEAYLASLIRAQKKINLLEQMAEDAGDLTGSETDFDRQKLQEQIDEDISRFISELSRISAATDFDEDQTVAELEGFIDEIKAQQKVLIDVTQEFQKKSYTTQESS